MEQIDVALKEWSVTCRALEAGRQIFILRKGGLQDADATFQVEHNRFLLAPSKFHEDNNLVKPDHHDLFCEQDAEQKYFCLTSYCEVVETFSINSSEQEKLREVDHIWSDDYLDLRFGFAPERPLLCVALRVFPLKLPIQLEPRPEFGGCRSWIDLPESFSVNRLEPVLDQSTFDSRLRNLEIGLQRPLR